MKPGSHSFNLGIHRFLFLRWGYEEKCSRGTKYHRGGFGLIEIIVVTAIIVTAFASFSQIGILAVRALRSEKESLEMTLLAQEGLEAARALRDEKWEKIASFAYETPFYPVVEDGRWILLTTAPSPINERYTRTLLFGPVCRDSTTQRIKPPSSPCTVTSPDLDPNSRKVTARITDVLSNKEPQLITYLTNFPAFLAKPIIREEKAVAFETANSSTNLAHFPSDNTGEGDPAQSFTPLTNIRVTRLELRLLRMTVKPSNISAELWANAPSGELGGTSLGSSDTVNAATIPSIKSWVEFLFTKPIPLNGLTEYYIRLRSHPSSNVAGSGSVGRIHWIYKQSLPSPYLGGEAWIFIQSASDPTSAVEKPEHDFGFKVYGIIEEE